MSDAIRCITTWGTIDDIDFATAEEQEKAQPRKSLIPELLQQARITDIYISDIFQKDSRFITDEDREKLYELCMKVPEEKIIITHGTFTMPITAKFLWSREVKKTIILTGAMIPANKENSDALFNLGAAVIAVQALQWLGHWVYVTMNGKIFPRNDVRKNEEDGIFMNE